MYLDDHYWSDDRGGLIGPPGVLTQAVLENEGFAYRPLCEYHLDRPSIPSDYDIEVVWGRENCRRIREAVLAAPKLQTGIQPNPEVSAPGIPDERWVVARLRQNRAYALIVASQQITADDIAHVHTFVVGNSFAISQPARDCLWHVLCHELAINGFVGMTTLYPQSAGDHRYVGRLGFFHDVAEHAEERGHGATLASLKAERQHRLASS